jgi:hypothetical protein
MERDLRHLLEELRAAIHRTREGDADRDELNRLAEAVERRLAQADREAAADSDEERQSLIDSLEAAALRFDAEHPVLGQALLRAVDALSAAGI